MPPEIFPNGVRRNVRRKQFAFHSQAQELVVTESHGEQGATLQAFQSHQPKYVRTLTLKEWFPMFWASSYREEPSNTSFPTECDGDQPLLAADDRRDHQTNTAHLLEET